MLNSKWATLSQRQEKNSPPKDGSGLPLRISGKKKTHKHKLFCPVGLGTTPGLSRGFHRVCPWDKSGENLGQTRVFSLFYTVEARFHRVCPWDKPGLFLGQSRGRRAAQKVYVKNVYVPFSVARIFSKRFLGPPSPQNSAEPLGFCRRALREGWLAQRRTC